MLDSVKEEYRNEIDELYNDIISNLKDTYSYLKSEYSNNTSESGCSVDETSIMAYSEIISQLYNGNASIGRRNSRGVRRVKYLDEENGLHYIFEPNTQWSNTLEISKIFQTEQTQYDKFQVDYPLSKEMNDKFVEYLELCYNARNKVTFQDPSDFILASDTMKKGEDFFKFYTMTVKRLQRNRKINSIFA